MWVQCRGCSAGPGMGRGQEEQRADGRRRASRPPRPQEPGQLPTAPGDRPGLSASFYYPGLAGPRLLQDQVLEM